MVFVMGAMYCGL